MEQLATKATGRPNYISRGRYDDWSTEDILKHLVRVAKAEGGKPTKAMLWRRINNEGRDEPSPRYISSRLPFRAALELIGYPNVHSWEISDYRHWGVNYLKANGAILPTATTLDYLSKTKRGPSAAQIGNIFGKLNNYKAEIWRSYKEDRSRDKIHTESRLDLIEEGIRYGSLNINLFTDVSSEQEMISRFAKYQVAKELFQDTADESIIKDCLPNGGRSFISKLRKRNGILSAGEIESTALYLGVFDDIWPPDQSSIEALKVPAELITSHRINLSLANLALPG